MSVSVPPDPRTHLSTGTHPARRPRQREDHASFQERDLSDRDFVYVWADGVHSKVRLGKAHSCVLVLLGVRLDGTRELIALAEGGRARGGYGSLITRDRP